MLECGGRTHNSLLLMMMVAVARGLFLLHNNARMGHAGNMLSRWHSHVSELTRG